MSPLWRDSGTWIALGVSLVFIVAGIVMHRVFVHILKTGADEDSAPPSKKEPEHE
ncbi:hypothetical protein [Acidovorax sp. PRC11]|uniref:hypothetical protein n=1 Tax=Acidovorax sp. PRC11 TaxID=2962592 RepID=UPI002882832E|nr:hypothetical protein [Acidovorax sp. PRC11]MDT0139377.1 hypothetical protein [Acidovorax sp. PRC11]